MSLKLVSINQINGRYNRPLNLLNSHLSSIVICWSLFPVQMLCFFFKYTLSARSSTGVNWGRCFEVSDYISWFIPIEDLILRIAHKIFLLGDLPSPSLWFLTFTCFNKTNLGWKRFPGTFWLALTPSPLFPSLNRTSSNAVSQWMGWKFHCSMDLNLDWTMHRERIRGLIPAQLGLWWRGEAMEADS